jgi:hypothetical protein
MRMKHMNIVYEVELLLLLKRIRCSDWMPTSKPYDDQVLSAALRRTKRLEIHRFAECLSHCKTETPDLWILDGSPFGGALKVASISARRLYIYLRPLPRRTTCWSSKLSAFNGHMFYQINSGFTGSC